MTALILRLKFSLILLALLSGLLFSCKKNTDGEGPTLTLAQGDGYISHDTTLAPGENFRIRILAGMGDERLTHLMITVSSEAGRIVVLDTGINNESIDNIRLLNKGASDQEHWTILLRDAMGREASVGFVLGRTPGSGFGAVKHYPSLLLGAQKSTAAGSFCNLYSGAILFLQQAFMVQDSIDLNYYYDFTGDANTIASPNANIDTAIFGGNWGLYHWTNKHETRYYKTSMPLADFSAIQNDSLLLLTYNEQLAKRKAKNLAPGDIYSFRTSSNKYGIFRVVALAGSDEGQIEIEVKVQP